MQRPAGITVLAFAMFTVAAILFVVAYFCFVSGPLMAEIVHLPGIPPGVRLHSAIVGVIALIFAFLCLVCGAGLWKVIPAGRSLAIVLTLVNALHSVLGIVVGLSFLLVVPVLWRIVELGLALLILWYLFQPHLKKAFSKG